MKKYTVQQIDRRYSGSHFARYRIYINDCVDVRDFPAKIDLYRRMRDWCDDTWGHSCEVRYHEYLGRCGRGVNPHWSWNNPGKYNQFYFFLAGDAELTLFELKF
jgi:hypothetical protein